MESFVGPHRDQPRVHARRPLPISRAPSIVLFMSSLWHLRAHFQLALLQLSSSLAPALLQIYFSFTTASLQLYVKFTSAELKQLEWLEQKQSGLRLTLGSETEMQQLFAHAA